MSNHALDWVFRESQAEGHDRLVLIAMADEANDAGYLSGKEHGAVGRIAAKARVAKQTVHDATKVLEGNEIRGRQLPSREILVCRPADRGHGRHNEYVLLLGRDPAAVAASRGWPAPTGPDDWSASRTDPSEERPDEQDDDDVEEHAKDPDPGAQDAHRGAQTAPPVTSSTAPTSPVDDALTSSVDRSASRTGSTSIGLEPVYDRSAAPGTTPVPPSPQPSQVDLAHEPQPGWAAGVDEGHPMSALFEAVRAELAALAPATRWDLTSRQLLELTVHAAAWRDVDDAAAAFTAAAAEAIEHYGVPRSARAWRTTWLEVRPPEPMPGEPLCTEHAIDGYEIPVRICALCRQRDVVGAVGQ